MLVQETVLDFPLSHSSNFDQYIPKLNRVIAIQQRVQERQKKLQAVGDNHEAICQVAHDILGEPNIEQPKGQVITRTDLTEKLQAIRQRIQKRQEKLLHVEQEHDEVIQIADKALMQAEKETQNVERIEQEQKEIRQQMLIIGHDLKAAHGKSELLKQEQVDISQKVEFLQKILSEAFLNLDLMFPRLDKVLLKTSQIQIIHQEIDRRFEELHGQFQIVQIDQAKLGVKLDSLIRLSTSPDIEIVPKEIKDNGIMSVITLYYPTLKGAMQNFIDEFELSPYLEKFNEKWEGIKGRVDSITSYLGENLNHAFSKAIPIISWIASQTLLITKKIMTTLLEWTWTYIVENTSPITWIALGVIATCLVKQAISAYPLLSVVIGGYLFFVFKNSILPLFWPAN